jgi:hypothetical protein
MTRYSCACPPFKLLKQLGRFFIKLVRVILSKWHTSHDTSVADDDGDPNKYALLFMATDTTITDLKSAKR